LVFCWYAVVARELATAEAEVRAEDFFGYDLFRKKVVSKSDFVQVHSVF
jgi:hypothetical protein